MEVSNPNKGSNKVENKKSSFFGSLLGYFFNNTKTIVNFILLVSVTVIFSMSFLKAIDFIKISVDSPFSMLGMQPLEVFIVYFTKGFTSLVTFFIPFLLLVLIFKYIMIKRRGFKIEYVFNKKFKRQVVIAFLISFSFSVLFYVDMLAFSNFPHLIEFSIMIFVFMLFSVLFAMTSMYGILKGIDPILVKNKK